MTAAETSTWSRPGPTGRQQRLDLLWGALITAATLVSLELARSTGLEFGRAAPSRAECVAWVLAITLPLWVRRRFPLLVLVLCSAMYIGLQARFVPEGTMTSVCLFMALYTAGAWSRDRRVTDAVRSVVVVAMFCWMGIALSTTAWGEAVDRSVEVTGLLPPATASLVYVTLLNVLFFAGAWIFGNQAWNAARQRIELQERAQQLQVERVANARRAVLDERVRIARELHDVVAHHVSVMGVQAGAARRLIEPDPDRARAAVATIEQSSRAAVEEMRRLLGMLRDEDVASPPPGLDRLPQLGSEVATGAGPRVQVEVIGAPRELPESLSVSAYRITQEALTNVVKHAGATTADIRLRYLPEEIEIEVVDDGRRAPQAHQASGAGLGQQGMRERVELHGGRLEVGPRTDGGYRVRARLPAVPVVTGQVAADE